MDVNRDFLDEQEGFDFDYERPAWNQILRDENGERIVYGHWSMYTKQLTDNPTSVEEEIEFVLDKLQSKIEYFANLSFTLGIEDYQAYIVDWVMKHQHEHGGSTSDEINLYTMRLVEDINRYRAQSGYSIPIPTRFFKSFNAVLMVYKNNPWMTKDDIHNLAEDVLKKNIYYIQTKNKEKPYSNFIGIVDKVFYEDSKMLQQYRSLTCSSSEFKNAIKEVENVLPGAYDATVVKNVVKQLLSENTPDINKNSNYYNIKFSLLKSKSPKSFLRGKKLTTFICSCMSDSDFIKTVDIEEFLKALWSIGIKCSYQEAKEFVAFKEKSALYGRVYNYYSRQMTRKAFRAFCSDNNIIPSSRETDYSARIGICVKDKHGNYEVVSAYRNSNDIDVVVKNQDGYFLVSHTTWDKIIAGRDLMMHGSYSKIGPRKIKTVKVNNLPVLDLFDAEIKRQETLEQSNDQMELDR